MNPYINYSVLPTVTEAETIKNLLSRPFSKLGFDKFTKREQDFYSFGQNGSVDTKCKLVELASLQFQLFQKIDRLNLSVLTLPKYDNIFNIVKATPDGYVHLELLLELCKVHLPVFGSTVLHTDSTNPLIRLIPPIEHWIDNKITPDCDFVILRKEFSSTPYILRYLNLLSSMLPKVNKERIVELLELRSTIINKLNIKDISQVLNLVCLNPIINTKSPEAMDTDIFVMHDILKVISMYRYTIEDVDFLGNIIVDAQNTTKPINDQYDIERHKVEQFLSDNQPAAEDISMHGYNRLDGHDRKLVDKLNGFIAELQPIIKEYELTNLLQYIYDYSVIGNRVFITSAMTQAILKVGIYNGYFERVQLTDEQFIEFEHKVVELKTKYKSMVKTNNVEPHSELLLDFPCRQIVLREESNRQLPTTEINDNECIKLTKKNQDTLN